MSQTVTITPEQVLAAAEHIRADIVRDRRTLHAAPEVGTDLPHTAAYVKKRLTEMGYQPRELAGGVVAEITGADTGRCLLLRADMDALRVVEQTGLDFASTNGCMHACGHDMHAAMLLGAAKLLREYQSQLQGTVKLVFQPDEEGFTGAKAMLSAGVLQNPAPQAGFALHVNSGTPTGLVLCGRGTFMSGCTLFRITVNGVGCHGAMPEKGVDPLNIASHIYLSLQEIISREIGAKTPAVVTIGRMMGGEAPNIIPQTAVLEGTIRSFDRDLSAQIFTRIGEIAQCTAQAFRGTAVTEEIASAPPLKNDTALTERAADLAAELFGEKLVYRLDEGGMASEDFAAYTYDLPCAYLLIGAGTEQENPAFGKPMHNEKVVFNEDILPRGAALHAWYALNWLAEQGGETK